MKQRLHSAFALHITLTQANGYSSLAVVTNATTAYFFDYYGGAYHARFGGGDTLVHDTTDGWYVLTDSTGQTFTFDDFSSSTPTGRASSSA